MMLKPGSRGRWRRSLAGLHDGERYKGVITVFSKASLGLFLLTFSGFIGLFPFPRVNGGADYIVYDAANRPRSATNVKLIFPINLLKLQRRREARRPLRVCFLESHGLECFIDRGRLV